MATIKIDGETYDTDAMTSMQKRLTALYQLALKEESEAMAKVDLARAARIEITRRVKEAFKKDETKS